MNPRTLAIALVVGIVLLGAYLLYGTLTEPPPLAPPAAPPRGEPAPTATAGAPEAPAATVPDEQTANAAAEAVERDPAALPTSTPFVRVRVVDPDAQPIAGATVQSFEDSTPGRRQTDGDGWCTLPVHVEGATMKLRISAGLRHRQAFWQPLPELTVKLPWSGPLQGRLVDDVTGAAVAGAEVRAPHNYCKQCEPEVTHSAADGSFTLPAVPRDENCTFVVRAQGYPHQYFALQLPGRGEALAHTFRLLPGVVVAGRCVDLDGRRALAGVVLRSGGDDLATTSVDGGFRVLMRPGGEGTVELEMACPGFCRVTYEIRAPQPDGAVEYALPRASAIAGDVRDARGNPIANARVTANRDYREAAAKVEGMPAGCRVDDAGSFPQAHTDAAGRFRIDELVPGRAYRVSARHDDFLGPSGEDRWGVPAVARADAAPLHIVLEPRPALGPSGVIVGVYRCDGVPMRGLIRWHGATRDGSARIESNGTFRLEHVQAGVVVLRAIAEPFQFAAEELRDRLELQREVRLEADEELRVELEQRSDGPPIRGRVTHPDGSPVANQVVTGSCQRLHLRATTDATGAYELRVPALLTNVRVAASGEPREREVDGGAVGVDFVVPWNGTLRYRIVRNDGADSYTRVLFRGRGERYFRPFSNLDAPDLEGFRHAELPRGSYELAAVATGMAPSLLDFVIGEQPASLVVPLTSGTVVTLHRADDAEPWPPALRLEFVDEPLADRGLTPRDFAGFLAQRVFDLGAADLEVRAVAPGRHRLAPTDPSVEILPATIDVGTSPSTFEVRWRRRP
ncbi:MAG TPA: hypothetical protein VFZ65_08020 [Planctomycetota bacterium]|nr:hypothetical protein [Planctomycetota bacterium]